MPTRHVRTKLTRAAVVYVTAVATTLPILAVSTPVAAGPGRAVETSMSDGIIEIDGAPVTIELEAGGAAELDFEWDASRRVFFWWSSCSNMYVQTFSTYDLPSIDFACGDILDDPSPDWSGNIPLDRSRLGDPGPHIMTFRPFNVDGGSHPASVTVRLTSEPPPPEAGPITPGGDPLALEATGRYGAVWVSFSGEQGDNLTLQTLNGDCDARYRVRLPDDKILADRSTHGIDSCNADVYPGWSLGELPVTGTYRIEIVAGPLGMGPRGIQLTFNSAPKVCIGHEIAPIMLVHGFNGDSGDWNLFRPLLVHRLTEEFERAGVPLQEAAICADQYVYAVTLGPQDSSGANGLLLLSEINGFLDRTGAERVDIIAHSKGGLDSRRAIQMAGDPSPVRNLLMIATPNRGTFLADIACGLHNIAIGVLAGPILTIINRIIETAFGPCRGPEDALYGITEDFVLKTFNAGVVDRPDVVYQTIAGASTCSVCRVLSVLLTANDSLVPVISALGPTPFRYQHLETFDLEHSQFQETAVVLELAYCSLTGRRPAPLRCGAEPSQLPPGLPTSPSAPEVIQEEPNGGLAHVDALEIAGGGSEVVTLPIGNLGPTGVAVVASDAGVSAAVDGEELDAAQSELGHTLATQIDSPVDVDLTISNPGTGPADVMVLVFGTNNEALQFEVTPGVAAPTEPVEIRVPNIDSVASLQGVVTDPSGDQAELTFAADGSDAVATYMPTGSGDHLIAVLQDGARRQVAFNRFVAGAGAATLAGSFTESLEPGQDSLASALHLDVDIEVSQPGQYRLTGSLTTTDGVEVATTEASAELAEGPRQLRLTVPGAVLYGAGQDGPYHLALTLLREDPDTQVATLEAQVAGTSPTQPYLADSFQPAAISPGYVSVGQGEFDTVVAEVPVTLSEPITRPVTVGYTSLNPTGDQYAHSPDDFQAVAGTLTFLPGETAKTIEVTVNGDPDQQGNLLAVIELTGPANATLGGDGQGGVAILAEPTAVIDTPGPALTWSTGDEVSFSGHVNDPVEGLLPASALAWTLRLQHCPAPPDPAGCHTHLLQEWNGVTSGSFTAPDHGYPAHLELELTAAGTPGLTHHTVHKLHPNTVELTLASAPPGRLLAAGFPPALILQPAPFTMTAIQGSTVLLSAPDHTENGTTYVFHQWSQGGPAQQPIQAPTVPTTYTATFATDIVAVDPPSAAAGQYPAVAAAFGPPPSQEGLGGDIALVNDASPNPTEGCNPLVGFPSGAIALIDRGTCPFTQKVRNAQNAGAAAVIVVNSEPGDPFEMGGTDPAITLPSVMLALDHGNTIKTGLPTTGTIMRTMPDPPPGQTANGPLWTRGPAALVP